MHVINKLSKGVLIIIHDYIVYRNDSIRLDLSFDEFVDEMVVGFKSLAADIVDDILACWDEISNHATGYSELADIMTYINHKNEFVREAIAIHGGPKAQASLVGDISVEVRRALATYAPMHIKSMMVGAENNEEINRLLACLGDESIQIELIDSHSEKVRKMLAVCGTEAVQMKLIADKKPVVINALRSYGSDRVLCVIEELYGEIDVVDNKVTPETRLSMDPIPTLTNALPEKEVING